MGQREREKDEPGLFFCRTDTSLVLCLHECATPTLLFKCNPEKFDNMISSSFFFLDPTIMARNFS